MCTNASAYPWGCRQNFRTTNHDDTSKGETTIGDLINLMRVLHRLLGCHLQVRRALTMNHHYFPWISSAIDGWCMEMKSQLCPLGANSYCLYDSSRNSTWWVNHWTRNTNCYVSPYLQFDYSWQWGYIKGIVDHKMRMHCAIMGHIEII